MSQDIDAIYENGAFRPLQPLEIPDGMRVQLHFVAGSSVLGVSQGDNPEAIARQREALAQLRAKMDALPAGASVDGLGGADHDQILYGQQK
jgi:predicted DNA-binding antitoxin AbrB/MazE fold protein